MTSTAPHPFFQWFASSKVVDEAGSPLLVYHGSPKGETPAFGEGTNQTPKIHDGSPFFVTDNPAYARDFARGGVVTSLYVRLENPADLSDPHLVEELLTVMRADPSAQTTLVVMNNPEDAGDLEGSAYFLLESPMVMAHLKAKGFDGAVIVEDIEKGVTSYAAFQPEQIKQARHCLDPWFFDSKVTNPDGTPLVVFHGTNAHAYSEGGIESFHTQPASGRGGAFFTSDRGLAAQYGERVYDVHLSLKNPLIVEGDGKSWGSMSGDTRIDGGVPDALRLASQKAANELTTLFADMDELFAVEGEAVVASPKIQVGATSLAARTLGDIPGLDTEGLETDAIVKTARKMGFDGVVFRNVQDSPTLDSGYAKVLADVYVAFDSQQIRHVAQLQMEAALNARDFLAEAMPHATKKTRSPN